MNIIQFPPITSGGGGSVTESTYTNPTPAPSNLGGVAAGDTFTNVAHNDMWTKLLYPYQTPTFTAFNIAGIVTKEVGDTISAGSKAITWTTTNNSNIQSNTIVIRDVTNSQNLASALDNDGNEAVITPAYTKSSATSHTWQISATDIKGTTLSRNLTSNWYWKIYYGESALSSLTETDVEALRASSLVSTINGTYNMLAGGYKYWAYPTTMGLKTTWKDTSTGFDVAMNSTPQTVSLTNSFGVTQNYYVYRTYNILGGTINVQIS